MTPDSPAQDAPLIRLQGVSHSYREGERSHKVLQGVDLEVARGEVLALLWRRRTFRHMAFGAALNAFAGYASASWTASFMIRSYEMSTGELGTWLALISGACGAVGVFVGGIVADKLGVPVLYRFEITGTPEDVIEVKERLAQFWQIQS